MNTQIHNFTSQVVKIGFSRQIIIPKRLYDEFRLRPGNYLEVQRSGARIILQPKQLVNWELEADLAESREDARMGRVYGPFSTAKKLVASLNKEGKKLKKKDRESLL